MRRILSPHHRQYFLRVNYGYSIYSFGSNQFSFVVDGCCPILLKLSSVGMAVSITTHRLANLGVV